jgi:cytochrome c oxidase assembly protein subunit 15
LFTEMSQGGPKMVLFQRLNLLAVLLCYCVVVFGAFVRLSDAGLGCPDWPGCYGHITVPQADHEVARAEARYPDRPVEAHKAWKEMIHRYLAGSVGLLLLAMAVLALRDRGRNTPLRLVLATLAVILVQIVFGALTVTMKVNPLIVTTHLMLGLTTLALLWWAWLCGRPVDASRLTPRPGAARALAVVAVAVVVLQVFLGGWTSTNYAAVSCPDFPTCAGSYGLQAPLSQAFQLWHGHGRDYEFGILDVATRASIHMVHRYGALLTAVVIGGIALMLVVTARAPLWRRLGAAIGAALLLQLAIGVSLIHFQFPLWLADAHNAGAALLLLSVIAFAHFAYAEAGPS